MLPLAPSAANPAYASDPGANANYTALIIANYTTLQFSTHDVSKALSKRVAKTEPVYLDENRNEPPARAPHWQIEKKLTARDHGKNLFLYGNADIFTNMSLAASRLSSLGDDVSINDRCIHHHFDSYENTAKSFGILLAYYWSGHEG